VHVLVMMMIHRLRGNAVITFEQATTEFFNQRSAMTIVAEDAAGISRIEVFIDDAKIAEQDFAGPVAKFDFEFDTKTVSDGVHVMKIVVYDSALEYTVFEKAFIPRSGPLGRRNTREQIQKSHTMIPGFIRMSDGMYADRWKK
jgi:hypothetical protein